MPVLAGWQQAFAFSHGLDKNLPAFTYFWLTLLAFNLLVLPSVFAIWYLRMWKSAGNPAAQITRQQEGKRLWNLWLLTLAFTVAVFFGGSFFAEEDASWHQVVIRDTAFTPSHIVLFFGIFPLLIYLAAGIYIYGRTNLPHMYGGRRFPVSIGLIIGGSVLLLFQVAMNEFGHSFFTPEELFVAPLHWPFVIFGYLLAGTFAIWFETLPASVNWPPRAAGARGWPGAGSRAACDGRGRFRDQRLGHRAGHIGSTAVRGHCDVPGWGWRSRTSAPPRVSTPPRGVARHASQL